jgi:fatty acid desaturase
MAKNTTKYVGGGTSLCTLLTVAFVVLKLCGIINWSWFWVLSPTLIPLIIVLVCLLILFCVYVYAKTRS